MFKILLFILTVILCGTSYAARANRREQTGQPDQKPLKYSTTVEKQRPKLNEETRKLIAAYRLNPTNANRNALRKQSEINYDESIERKKAKLEELKQTPEHAYKAEEMQKIIDEMLRDRELRIVQTVNRFTDPRFRTNSPKSENDFSPVSEES